MEAYFSQVVLSRLLGRSPSLSHVVTGQIGERLRGKRSNIIRDRIEIRGRNRPIADYEFDWPAQVLAKLRYVFRSRYFESLILPDLDKLLVSAPESRQRISRFIKQHSSEHTCEVKFTYSLSGVADNVQTGGWRQSRYVRCPDIGYTLHPQQRHPRHGRGTTDASDAENARLESCLSILRGSTSTIPDLPSDVSASDVGKCLSHIDQNLRQEIPQYDTSSTRQRPQLISWVFVRTTPDEVDERFWYLLWRLTGAPLDVFDTFRLSPSPAIAAGYLAELLNRFDCTEADPGFRSPDVLVIVGAARLMEDFDPTKDPLARPLAFGPVVKELANLIKPHPQKRMHDLLGCTRLIVLPIETPSISLGTAAGRLSASEMSILECLRVFRFGFTQQMASLLLRELQVAGEQVRQVLRDLEDKGRLRYFAGEYYIPDRITQEQEEVGDATTLARRHYAAGLALAPYLSRVSLPGLSLDRAFLPEHVHEAEHHFTKALMHARRVPAGQGFPPIVRACLQRVQRFADLQGWHTVQQLSKGGIGVKDAYRLARWLLARRAQFRLSSSSVATPDRGTGDATKVR